ncbi:MAG TPA: MSHA biogenesis protein MshE, partial [Cellvibrionaceae bacterium]
MSNSTAKRIRLGDLLVSKDMITEAQLQHALQEQKLTGRKLGHMLIELGFVEEMALLDLLSDQLNIPFIDLKQYRFDTELVKTLPETSARRYRVLVLREDADGILLGMADPTDIFCLDDLQRQLNKPIK